MPLPLWWIVVTPSVSCYLRSMVVTCRLLSFPHPNLITRIHHVSITTTGLADSFSSSVPELNLSLAGIRLYSVSVFNFAVDAKGFWGHFRSDLRPTLSSPATDAEIAAEAQWLKNERPANSQRAR